MANNHIEFKGLEELKRALRNLPRDMAADAAPIVHDAAERARSKIEHAYPEHTGNLKRGLRVDDKRTEGNPYGATAVVINRAPHAYIYESGTEAIRLTSTGVSRGRMPAGNVFIPNVIRERRVMYEELKEMMKSHGLEVKGDA